MNLRKKKAKTEPEKEQPPLYKITIHTVSGKEFRYLGEKDEAAENFSNVLSCLSEENVELAGAVVMTDKIVGVTMDRWYSAAGLIW